MANERGGTRLWLAAQLALIGLAALVLAAWPPRDGALLLVPIGPEAARHAVPLALAAQAILLAPGPLPRSYIVRGDRDALARALLPAGILVVAGSARSCGPRETSA